MIAWVTSVLRALAIVMLLAAPAAAEVTLHAEVDPLPFVNGARGPAVSSTN